MKHLLICIWVSWVLSVPGKSSQASFCCPFGLILQWALPALGCVTRWAWESAEAGLGPFPEHICEQQSSPWPSSGGPRCLEVPGRMPWQVGRLIQGLAKVKAGRAEVQGNPGKSEENMVRRDPEGRPAGDRAYYLVEGCVDIMAYLCVAGLRPLRGPSGEGLRVLQGSVCALCLLNKLNQLGKLLRGKESCCFAF